MFHHNPSHIVEHYDPFWNMMALKSLKRYQKIAAEENGVVLGVRPRPLADIAPWRLSRI